MTSLRAGLVTDVGRVREANQDAGLATEQMVIVADGMGGHRGGETASRIAIDTVRAAGAPATTHELIDTVVAANEAIFGAAQHDPALDGMGTTLTGIALLPGLERPVLAVVNVGDSRTYLFHDDVLRTLTDDHSLVATMVRDGHLTEDEALAHPHRNILTRALGVDPTVDVDAWEVEPAPGDRLLLCSDGLVNEVSDAQIAAVLRRLADPAEAADELVRLANEHGGRDNVTVAVVDLVDVSAAHMTVGGGNGDAPPVERRPVAALGLMAASRASSEPEAVVREADPGPSPELADVDIDSDDPDRGFVTPKPVRERASRFTWRVGAFLLFLMAIAGIAVLAIADQVRGTYFVGVDRGEVVVYRGQPGGVLWFDPTVVERSGVRLTELTEQGQALVEGNSEADSFAEANAVLQGLVTAMSEESAVTETTVAPTPSTTTEKPAPSTTTTAQAADLGVEPEPTTSTTPG